MSNENTRYELYLRIRDEYLETLDAEEEEAVYAEELRHAAISHEDGSMGDDECHTVWLGYCAAVSKTKEAVDKHAATYEELYKFEVEDFPSYFYRFGKKEQITLLESEVEPCPNCPDRKLRKHGKRCSDYHDVFTDHKLSVVRKRCPDWELLKN